MAARSASSHRRTRRRSSSGHSCTRSSSIVSSADHDADELSSVYRRFEGVYLRARKFQAFQEILSERGVSPDVIRALGIVKWNAFGSGEQGPPKDKTDYLRGIIERVVEQAKVAKAQERTKAEVK